jgi:hypothetical protein
MLRRRLRRVMIRRHLRRRVYRVQRRATRTVLRYIGL